MKLAIVRQRYDEFGGAERFIAAAARELERAGVSITVIAREWSNGQGAPEASLWVRCDPFYLGRIWRDRGFARAACAVTARENFDLVQAHERMNCCDIFRAGDGVHAQWLEYRAKGLSRARKLWQWISPFHRHLLAAEKSLFASPRLRAVICNSRMVESEIESRFEVPRSKLHVIYNGVDLSRFNPSVKARRGEMLETLGIPATAKVLLFVGSGFERKGVAALLGAISRLERDDVYLLVVGKDRRENGYRARAHALSIDSKIRWVGAQRDIAPWYGCADAFVLPTIYDPFPNAALEALACGVPIVVSGQCGAAEIVREGWNGFVVEDPLDIASLVIKLRAAIEPNDALAANALESAQPFALEKMTLALLGLYQHLNSGSDSSTRA